MGVQHSTLTGTSLHEPKGVATAAAGTVYQADGAGSGSWVVLGTLPTAPTTGDIIYYGGSAWGKLSAGTSGYVLTSNGAGSLPTYQAIPAVTIFDTPITGLSAGVVYTAATNGILVISHTVSSGTGEVIVYSDASTPPTTEVGRSQIGVASNTISIPIFKTNYYSYSSTGASNVIRSATFIPVGS